MWVDCDACDGERTCPDGCCDCPVCGGTGGAEFSGQDHDTDF
jgi:hypothetical protein